MSSCHVFVTNFRYQSFSAQSSLRDWILGRWFHQRNWSWSLRGVVNGKIISERDTNILRKPLACRRHEFSGKWECNAGIWRDSRSRLSCPRKWFLHGWRLRGKTESQPQLLEASALMIGLRKVLLQACSRCFVGCGSGKRQNISAWWTNFVVAARNSTSRNKALLWKAENIPYHKRSKLSPAERKVALSRSSKNGCPAWAKLWGLPLSV